MQVKIDNNLVSSKDIFTVKAAAKIMEVVLSVGTVALGATLFTRTRQMLPAFLQNPGLARAALTTATATALLTARPLERVAAVAETARDDAAGNSQELRIARNAATLRSELDKKAAGEAQGMAR